MRALLDDGDQTSYTPRLGNLSPADYLTALVANGGIPTGDPGSIAPDAGGNPPPGTTAVAPPQVAAPPPAPPQIIAPGGPPQPTPPPAPPSLLTPSAPQQSLPTPPLAEYRPAPPDPFASLGTTQGVSAGSVMPFGSPTGYQAAQTGAPTAAGPVAQVGAPPTPGEYATALQQSFAPMFQDQQRQLAARESAMGILDSGSGRQDFSDLASRQSATLAGNLLPLIQQGFTQQFSANQQNAGAQNDLNTLLTNLGFANTQANAGRTDAASQFGAGAVNAQNAQMTGLGAQRQDADANRLQGAYDTNAAQRNAYLSQLTGLASGAAESNAQRDLQAQEFNQSQLGQFALANMGATNQDQLARMGYGNADYLTQLRNLVGLQGQGLSSLGSILGTGQGDMLRGFLSGQNLGTGFAQQIGYNAGYGGQRSTGAGGANGGTDPYAWIGGTATPPTHSTIPNPAGDNGSGLTDDPYYGNSDTSAANNYGYGDPSLPTGGG